MEFKKETNEQANRQKRNRLTDTENRLVVAIGEGGCGEKGEMGEGDKEVQVSNYKIN